MQCAIFILPRILTESSRILAIGVLASDRYRVQGREAREQVHRRDAGGQRPQLLEHSVDALSMNSRVHTRLTLHCAQLETINKHFVTCYVSSISTSVRKAVQGLSPPFSAPGNELG